MWRYSADDNKPLCCLSCSWLRVARPTPPPPPFFYSHPSFPLSCDQSLRLRQHGAVRRKIQWLFLTKIEGARWDGDAKGETEKEREREGVKGWQSKGETLWRSGREGETEHSRRPFWGHCVAMQTQGRNISTEKPLNCVHLTEGVKERKRRDREKPSEGERVVDCTIKSLTLFCTMHTQHPSCHPLLSFSIRAGGDMHHSWAGTYLAASSTHTTVNNFFLPLVSPPLLQGALDAHSHR